MVFSAWVTLLVAAAPAHNVVVVVTDGLRPTEVFDGAQRELMGPRGGVTEGEAQLVATYWRPTAQARREALLPFLWGTMARAGQVFGNAALDSHAKVTNRAHVSYPGYAELFTGFADPAISSNAFGDNPNVTVLEWLARQPGFEGQVQAFATWDTFHRIFAVGRSHLPVRAGMRPPFEADSVRTSTKDAIDTLYRTATPLFGGNALDAYPLLALQETLRTERPRVLFVGLGETDEWMHHGRYDLALEAAHRADQALAQLWALLQSMPEYRDDTTLVFTTDHGRGVGEADWREHGVEVAGSDDIWVAALGPGVPALGERANVDCRQAQVAATLAAALGFDWTRAQPKAAPPLDFEAPRLAGR